MRWKPSIFHKGHESQALHGSWSVTLPSVFSTHSTGLPSPEERATDFVATVTHALALAFLIAVASAWPGPEPQFPVLQNGRDENSQGCQGNKIDPGELLNPEGTCYHRSVKIVQTQTQVKDFEKATLEEKQLKAKNQAKVMWITVRWQREE